MNTISLDAPFVSVKPRHSVEDSAVDQHLDSQPEIDQRDIEDLQIVAKWYESAVIEKEAIDAVFSNYDDELKSALSQFGDDAPTV